MNKDLSEQRRAVLPVRIVLFLSCLFLLSGTYPAWPLEIKVATYNVQNLFDLVINGTEYREYVPGNSFLWNKKIADIKYRNIARVVKDLNPDVLALQEVESLRALGKLRDYLCRSGLCYRFMAIAGSRPSAVKCALLSRFPIVREKEISVRKGSRNILAVRLNIEGNRLVLYVNHWKSKRGPESMRLHYAKALRAAIDQLPTGTDFILLGDFNSNYDEYKTLLHNPKLNDTHGITGINHVLLTLKKGEIVTERDLRLNPLSRYLYDLWLELPPRRRWSYNLFGRKGTPDHIILPAALYDHKGFSYVDNSFNKFAPRYLFRHHAIFQWQRANFGKGRHLGMGFSDHLPIYALFCTN